MHDHDQDHTGLNQLRERLAGKKGRQYWRSLEELSNTAEFQKFLDDEFPNRSSLLNIDRRTFLKYMGASVALAGLTGCRYLPEEHIVPYVKQPEDLTPGQILRYATAMTINGYAVGLLVDSHEGRPTKIEGNPNHPASLGATNAIAQASILGLYDPDRSQSVLHEGEVSTFEEFLAAARDVLAKETEGGGAGIRFLTETITSPTLAEQISVFQKKYPQSKWMQYEPAGGDSARAGSKLVFGDYINTVYAFDKADRVLSLDSDFLLEHPASIRYARDFVEKRRVRKGVTEMNRLYAIESTPTITGAMADHRHAVRASNVEGIAQAVLVGVNLGSTGSPGLPWVDALVKDLRDHSGMSLVIAGANQSPQVHALAHQINQALGNVGKTVSYTEPVEANPTDQMTDIKQLVAEMLSGTVKAILIFGGNPAFDAPVDLEFSKAIAKVPFRARLGLYDDETSDLCNWHLPEAHYLEAWGDARAYDGTASIVQPLIQPLYGGRSALEIVAALSNKPRPGYEIVRGYWKRRQAGTIDFDLFFRKSLNDGVIPHTSAATKQVSPTAAPPSPQVPLPNAQGIEVIFRPDPNIGDGRYANNNWLQELPKPMTKLVWDNAALISPKTAVDMGYAQKGAVDRATGTVVEITLDGRKLKAPIFVLPGHPDNCVTLHFGYGRTKSGEVGNGLGVNPYRLRTSSSPLFTQGAALKSSGDSYELVSTHYHSSMDMKGRDPVLERSFEEFVKDPELTEEQKEEYRNKPDTIFEAPEDHRNYPGYKWGMSIDLNTCIGCNACTAACQAENNIPTVFKDQVAKGREMHWIRIDRYYTGELENPDGVVFQPVPCMHCEKAPCEPVCPVAATVHSHEGLNQMVYNRCVGTRYCSNNCPYKVRRFNFLNYTNDTGTPGAKNIPVLKLLANPDVTVRGRGVMEKCSYCVQRINRARIEAKVAGREIKDGEVVTACQQACPTKAITFGNIADKDSQVSKLKDESHDYTLLAEVNTIPRTTYLMKFRNPNPEIKTSGSHEEAHA